MIFWIKDWRGTVKRYDGLILDHYDERRDTGLMILCKRCNHWKVVVGEFEVKEPCRCC
jgi:hypothetical protein